MTQSPKEVRVKVTLIDKTEGVHTCSRVYGADGKLDMKGTWDKFQEEVNAPLTDMVRSGFLRLYHPLVVYPVDKIMRIEIQPASSQPSEIEQLQKQTRLGFDTNER